MKKTIFPACAAALALSASSMAWAGTDPASFPFDVAQLSGTWVSSYSTDAACSAKNAHFHYEFSSDKKRLTLAYDREADTALGGDKRRIEATILSATSRTMVIRYDGETRMNSLGKPFEWELAIVAPGIYRWRATDWKPGQVNTVVGVKCPE